MQIKNFITTLTKSLPLIFSDLAHWVKDLCFRNALFLFIDYVAKHTI